MFMDPCANCLLTLACQCQNRSMRTKPLHYFQRGLIITALCLSAGTAGTNLTEERLTRGKWNATPNVHSGNITLSFNKGIVKWNNEVADSDARYTGKYTITGNQALIRGLKMMRGGEEQSFPDYNCVLRDADDSPQYREKLVCANIGQDDNPEQFFDTAATMKVGTEKYFEKVRIVYSPRKMQTTATLVVRKRPDKSAEPVAWFAEKSGGGLQERKNFHKGEKVSVLARTKEKMAVGSLNDYWYYVEISAVSEVGMMYVTDHGWVFGAYLK
jgi:hypothetical protein